MTFSIVFRRAAKVEFEKAAVWYDEQRPGLGEEFMVEIGTPDTRPWGQRDFALFDPSGVLWRVGQNPPRQV